LYPPASHCRIAAKRTRSVVSAGVSGTVIVVLPPELPESVFPELPEVLLAAASSCFCFFGSGFFFLLFS